jgi:hypothetical protein
MRAVRDERRGDTKVIFKKRSFLENNQFVAVKRRIYHRKTGFFDKNR